MKVGETIRIQKPCGDWFFAHVEEFHPYEPSAYVHVPYWTLVSNPGTDAEQDYELEEDGSVFQTPHGVEQQRLDFSERRLVGEVPSMVEEYTRRLDAEEL